MRTLITSTIVIATLNDQCRKAMGVAGCLFQTQTPGISSLPLHDQLAIREKVCVFRPKSATEDRSLRPASRGSEGWPNSLGIGGRIQRTMHTSI